MVDEYKIRRRLEAEFVGRFFNIHLGVSKKAFEPLHTPRYRL